MVNGPLCPEGHHCNFKSKKKLFYCPICNTYSIICPVDHCWCKYDHEREVYYCPKCNEDIKFLEASKKFLTFSDISKNNKKNCIDNLKKSLNKEGYKNHSDFKCKKLGDKIVCWCKHKINDVVFEGDIGRIIIDSNGKIIEKYNKFIWNEETDEIKSAIVQLNNVKLENISDEFNFADKDKITRMIFNKPDIFSIYEFEEDVDFPVVCFVKKTESKIRIFNFSGKEIGKGKPPPSQSLSISGPEANMDCWKNWRINAEYWFRNWAHLLESLAFPESNRYSILKNIKNREYLFYYVIAHGDYNSYKCNNDKSNYEKNYITVIDVINSMDARREMAFSFLGHCGAMNFIGVNSFTCAFSKVNQPSEIKNSVIIGYRELEKHPQAWAQSLRWQDYFFYLCNKNPNKPFYNCYIEACRAYPDTINGIIFVGDKNYKLETVR